MAPKLARSKEETEQYRSDTENIGKERHYMFLLSPPFEASATRDSSRGLRKSRNPVARVLFAFGLGATATAEPQTADPRVVDLVRVASSEADRFFRNTATGRGVTALIAAELRRA